MKHAAVQVRLARITGCKSQLKVILNFRNNLSFRCVIGLSLPHANQLMIVTLCKQERLFRDRLRSCFVAFATVVRGKMVVCVKPAQKSSPSGTAG